MFRRPCGRLEGQRSYCILDTFGGGGIMVECSQCGECCRWFVVCQKRGLKPWQLTYLRERCDRETDQYFLLDAPCKHLVHHIIGSVIDGERVRKEHSTCDIYDQRPAICREYQGKRFSNGQIYYVPDSCALQGFCVVPSGEGNSKQTRETGEGL